VLLRYYARASRKLTLACDQRVCSREECLSFVCECGCDWLPDYCRWLSSFTRQCSKIINNSSNWEGNDDVFRLRIYVVFSRTCPVWTVQQIHQTFESVWYLISKHQKGTWILHCTLYSPFYPAFLVLNKLLLFLQAAKTDLFYSTFCVHSSTWRGFKVLSRKDYLVFFLFNATTFNFFLQSNFSLQHQNMFE